MKSFFKKTQLLAVALAFVASTAIATPLALPLIFGLSAEALLAPVAGLTIGILSYEVVANSWPVKLFFTTTEEAEAISPVDLPAPAGITTPTIPATYRTGFSGGIATFSIPPHTVNGITYPGVSVTAAPALIVEQLRTLDSSKVHASFLPAYLTTLTPISAPQVSLKYSTGSITVCASFKQFASSSSANPYCNTAATPAGETYYAEILYFAYSGANHTYTFPLTGVQRDACPTGYTRSTGTDKSVCDLTDQLLAKYAAVSFKDGKCLIKKYDPFLGNPDPDCAALSAAGAFTRETTQDGYTANVVKNPSNPAAPYFTAIPRADGGATLSMARRGADGSGSISVAEITKSGSVGNVSTSNYQAVPVPLYPGQTTANATGTTGSATSTAGQMACGGNGQPACKVEFAGDSNTLPPALSDNKEQPSGVLSEAVSRFTSLQSFSLPLQDASCLTALGAFDSNVNFFGKAVDIKISDSCQLLTPWESFLKLCARFGWSFLAMLIIFTRLTGAK